MTIFFAPPPQKTHTKQNEDDDQLVVKTSCCKISEFLEVSTTWTAVTYLSQFIFVFGWDVDRVVVCLRHRVPEDCLTKVVGEFLECPTLGFLQCRTTPLRAEDNYWEVSGIKIVFHVEQIRPDQIKIRLSEIHGAVVCT